MILRLLAIVVCFLAAIIVPTYLSRGDPPHGCQNTINCGERYEGRTRRNH